MQFRESDAWLDLVADAKVGFRLVNILAVSVPVQHLLADPLAEAERGVGAGGETSPAMSSP
jgi:hypothetical protein